MKKIDLKKEFKALYSPSAAEAELVNVPKFNYLMIDGAGDPNTSRDFQDAVQALYSAAYTLKFMIKKEKLVDYPVMPLEGVWWADDMSAFMTSAKADWKWTMMTVLPSVVTKALFRRAVKEAQRKKGLPALAMVRMEALAEGLSVQIMHIGPYAEEGPTIQKLHAFAADRSLALRGKHHEIYLGDPHKAKPEKLKTIIRQPVSRTGH